MQDLVKVLIVDDDIDLLEMMTLMLSANHMQVKALNAGALLFDELNTRTPDILIMDIYLGDSDGRHLCRQLKESVGYAGFPVFLYSAGEITHASIVESSADHFFRKPFDMSKLIREIHDKTGISGNN